MSENANNSENDQKEKSWMIEKMEKLK